MLKKKIIYLLESADIEIDGSRPWDITVHDDSFYNRLILGSLGFGESYMEGLWDCERLDEMFYRLLGERIEAKSIRLDKIITDLAGALLNLQTKSRSKKVAEIHYDIGNDFYGALLDPCMQYTCGYWEDAENLNDAQENKLDLICRKLMLKPGEEVLEMGCGWGGFAKYAAANYGCHVTAVNISREQVGYAREYCKGLPVKIIHSDYRDVMGKFDKVVSIGMLEHVGFKNYETFMKHVHDNMKLDSIALIHSIGNNTSTISQDPWLDKYIFPGSKCPSMRQIAESSEQYLLMEDWHNLSTDYDKTLMAWYDNFITFWPRFEKQYGATFFRMWSYYLLLCAGLFRSRKTQLWQIVFSRGGVQGGYQSIRGNNTNKKDRDLQLSL